MAYKETVITVLQNQTSIKLKAATLEKIDSEYSFVVADNSDYGFDMWQINPFTGIFSPKERWNILRGKNE